MNPFFGRTSASPVAGSPRILCISLGSIGRRHLRNARTLLPQAQIAVWRQHTADTTVPDGADGAIASLEAAQAFAPDAVIVSSPASEHVANAAPFVARGVPLFLEKPLAARSEDLGDFADRCVASPGFTMAGYVLRFQPALHAIRGCIRDGTLGEVHTARVEVGQYLPDWRPDSDYRAGVSAQRKLGGGALLELSHELDYATWLFGWPQSLLCSSAHLSQLEIDVEDSAHVLLEYADKRVSVQLDFLQRVATMAVQVVGSQATLRADLIREEITLFDRDHPEGRPLAALKLPNGNDLYLRQFDLFFSRAIAGYTPLYPETAAFVDWATVGEAGKVLRLVELAKTASDTGVRQRVAFGEEGAP
jgi:predicted dehydrogenase